jgi:hypothetical protein
MGHKSRRNQPTMAETLETRLDKIIAHIVVVRTCQERLF